jgi:hypothetical protein
MEWGCGYLVSPDLKGETCDLAAVVEPASVAALDGRG